MITPTDPQAGMRLRDGARLLGVSLSTFRQLIKEKIVDTYPVHPRSTHRRVTREAIEVARVRLANGDASSRRSQRRAPSVSPGPTPGLSKLNGDDFLKSLGL